MTDPTNSHYQLLLSDYRSKLNELRSAKNREENESIVRFIDNERNAIHNELRSVGAMLGKSRDEVALDLLVSEKDLSEYNLSEFKLLQTKKALDQITWVREIDSHGAIVAEYRPKKWDTQLSDWLPDSILAFIPFGEEEHWHLFDQGDYASRAPENFELRRRLFCLAELGGAKVVPLEVHSQKTYHQAVTLFGVACAPENCEYLFRIMREHLREISIDRQFFSQEQIRADFKVIVEEDLKNIFEYAKGTQDNTYHIERYRRIVSDTVFERKECYTQDILNDFNELMSIAQKNAELLDRRASVEKELDKEDLIIENSQEWIEAAERKRGNHK